MYFTRIEVEFARLLLIFYFLFSEKVQKSFTSNDDLVIISTVGFSTFFYNEQNKTLVLSFFQVSSSDFVAILCQIQDIMYIVVSLNWAFLTSL